MISFGEGAPAQKKYLTKTRDEAIHLVRSQRMMLDSDLAKIYGVSLKRLNEQVRRNAARFPKDFAFQLTRQGFANCSRQRPQKIVRSASTSARLRRVTVNAARA